MEFQRALEEIGDIRLQMSRTRLFRGYTAPMTLGTAFIAAIAGAWQADWIGNPSDAAVDPLRFVKYWMCAAAVCLTLAGITVARRYRESDSTLQKELTLSAVEQLLPSLCVGVLLTCVVGAFVPGAMWMLPGLWQVFFGLGIINSRKLLPGTVVIVGAFYVLCGLGNLASAEGSSILSAYSAWRMSAPFAIGQGAAALILRRPREENYAA